MKVSLASSSLLALLVSSSEAFAPLAPRQHRVTTTSKPSAAAHPRLFERPDPLSIMGEENQMQTIKKSTDPTPVLMTMMKNLSKDTNMQLAGMVMAFALTMMPLPSMAAMSGGRMGGSFSSSPSSSRMMSPSRSSYGSGYSRGYSSGYYSRPSSPIIVAPTITPFYSPFGFGGGFGYGSPGVISYNRGPSLISLLVFGGFAFAALNAVTSMASRGSEAMSDFTTGGISSALGPGRSVVQMSVAMDVSNRDDSNSILGALDRLSQTARTNNRVGIQNLTSQVAIELLRRKSSIVSAWTSSKHFRDGTQAQREFQSRSVRERSKFETETVSQYGGVDYTNSDRRRNVDSTSGKATMAVVTLVLSIDGDQTKLPQINSVNDVENALRRIAADVKVEDCLQSAEILWTPEDRTETLSMRDVVADYPELRSV